MSLHIIPIDEQHKLKGKKTRISEENRKIFEDYLELSLESCSYIAGWIKRGNYSSVAVCLSKFQFVNRLLLDEVALCSGVKFKWLITKFPGSRTLNGLKIKNFLIDYLDDIEVVIVDDENVWSSYEGIQAKMKSLTPIIKDIKSYDKKFRVIERLHGLQRNGVLTLILEMPRAVDVQNPSEWEKMLVRDKCDWRFSVLNDYDKFFPISGLDKKYTRELLESGNLIDGGQMRYKDYSVRIDRTTEYVNVKNHIRPALNIPSGAPHNIHMVGDSTIMSYNVMDEDTLATRLQHNINERFAGAAEGAPFSTLTYAAAGLTADQMQRRLRDIVVKQGDIVAIVGGHYSGFHPNLEFRISCKEHGVRFYDLQPFFNRPHESGEVFRDRMHPNPNGNVRIAEILYNLLLVRPGKMAVPDLFRHYFCGLVSGGGLSFSDSSAAASEEKGESSSSVSPELVSLMRGLETRRTKAQGVGAVVMNCNPFTYGHLHLVQTATSQVDGLCIFVVEEDKSEFSFTNRMRLVKAGTSRLPNLAVLPSSKFIISGFTFSEYFTKGKNQDIQIDATMDLEIFCKYIGPALGVRVRFVGEEPLDKVTLQYNSAMQTTLPEYGIGLRIFPRKMSSGAPISASRVRALLKNFAFRELMSIVPTGTMEYLVRRE